MLKVQTMAMASKLSAMQESMSRIEDMLYRQFGDNHRSVTGRFSENSFQNSLLGVDRDRNEHSDKRLKMQLFRGDDPFGWLFRADRFFALNGIEEGEKIYVASLYLLGPALKWFIGIEAHTSFPSWKAFRSAVLQRFGRFFPIDNSAGVLGRDHDEHAGYKSGDVSGRDCDEESGNKSGEVRESSLFFSQICTEVAVAITGDEDEDADTNTDVRLKTNKILGQIWKDEGVGQVSCFKDPLTLAAQLESPASFLSLKAFSPSWQPTSHTPVTATSFGTIGAGDNSLLQRQFLAYFRCRTPVIMEFLCSSKECFQGVQLFDGLEVPVAIPWLWKRRKKSAIAVRCYLKFMKKFSNWIFHKFKEKMGCSWGLKQSTRLPNSAPIVTVSYSRAQP